MVAETQEMKEVACDLQQAAPQGKYERERWTQPLLCTNTCNPEGNPTGGLVVSTGLEIKWQDGPLTWDYDKNTYGSQPNGAFTEDVCLALIQRVKFFQEAANKKFACRENAVAITKLEEALMWMQRRHDNRVLRKVQGEHKA